MISIQDIIDSKVFQVSIQEIEEDLWDLFQGINPLDTDQLQQIALKLWALREITAELESKTSVETPN